MVAALQRSYVPSRNSTMMTQSDLPVVRSMSPADAGGVGQMALELAAAVGDPPPVLDASQLLRDGSGPERWFDCFVAELKGALVGYAIACKGFEAHTGRRRLWIGDLYVRQVARGRGVGRALMRELARHALDLGCEALYWDLWRKNVAGALFYERLAAEEEAELAIMRLDKQHLAALSDAD